MDSHQAGRSFSGWVFSLDAVGGPVATQCRVQVVPEGYLKMDLLKEQDIERMLAAGVSEAEWG